jgi:hypothetical protein
MTIALAQTKMRPHWLQCPDCRGYFDPHTDTYGTVADGFDEKTICVNCIELAGETVCADCGEVVHANDCVIHEVSYQYRGRTNWRDVIYCEDCADEAGWAKCTGCDEWVAPDDQRESPGRDTYCDDCFCERYDFCGECGEAFYRDDMVVCDCEVYCTRCAPGKENFEPNGFKRRTGCTTGIGSERCFGVELETDYSDDYSELEDSGAWGAKDDCTVSGKEFYSDILDGDDGLAAIAELADVAEMNDWRVNDDCGFHLHLDARNESDDSMFAAAYAYRATQELWISFVDSSRDDSNYSHRARWALDDLSPHAGSFDSFLHNHTTSRYEWANFRAYLSHTTVKIRLHHGSIDGDEICNWIKAHTRFMDWATTTGYAGVKEALDGLDFMGLFDFIVDEVWKDDSLSIYYQGRSDLLAYTV